MPKTTSSRILHIRPSIQLVMCMRCRGKGKLIKGAIVVECPSCRGEGFVYQGQSDPLCMGECDGCIFAEDCYPAHRQNP